MKTDTLTDIQASHTHKHIINHIPAKDEILDIFECFELFKVINTEYLEHFKVIHTGA